MTLTKTHLLTAAGLAALCCAGVAAAAAPARGIPSPAATAAQPSPPEGATLTAPTSMVGADGRFTLKDGGEIYRNVCANCHMQDAKGATGAGTYPALASNPKLGAAAYPAMVVIHGQKGMPEFGPLLDDAQVAAVVGYIRTNFGNRYRDPVTAAEVKALR